MKPAFAGAAARAVSAPDHPVIDQLSHDGYVIFEDMLDEGDIEILSAEIEPWLQRTPRCEGDFYGWRTTRVGGLLDKAPMTQELAMHPAILAIAEAVLKPACDYVQLNLTQAVRIHPGERAQPPHRDEEMWPCEKGGVPWLINVMWALDDFTLENGATRLWPGSHRQALDRSIDPTGSIGAVMRKGSALVFLGALTHGAGANHSAAPRTGLIVSYCLGWLKSYENQFLAYPASVARSFPAALQRLIGYQIHRPNLGGVDGQDPILALAGPSAPRPHKDALPPEIAREFAALYHDNRAQDGDGGQ